MGIWQRWFGRPREEQELDDELRFHIEQEAELRIGRGESPDSARLAARRDFGNITLAREVTRDMWGWTALERSAQDLRFALRMLRKNVGFTVVAVAALTLGIGATTAMFSVVYSVLLKPLEFPEPDRLVMGWDVQPGGRTNVVQTQNFLDYRQRTRSFQDFAALLQGSFNLSGDGEPVQLPGLRVSAGFFEILGVSPLLGRTIGPAEDAVGASPVVVLSYGLWQRRFGGRPEALGQKIMLNGAPTEVIGVMREGFAFPEQRADLFTPLQVNPATAAGQGRNFRTVARLKPGVTLRQAQEDMRAVAAQLAVERPGMNARWSGTVVPLLEQTVGKSRSLLLVLLGAVGFVLLIACSNVSNLLLMRASTRRREMTLRVALGAGRWRLLHQLAMESLLLALAGGGLGFLLARWSVPAVLRVLPEGFPLPRTGDIAVDHTVLLFTLLLSLGCGLFFGIFPALQVDLGGMSSGLRQGGRTGTSGNRGLRDFLVVTEIAVAVLLVVGAGLMLRSFLLLYQTDPGFRTERLITFRMVLLPAKYKTPERRAAATREILDRVRRLPMVTAASTIHLLPLSGSQSGTGVYRTDRPVPPPGANNSEDVSVISDGYFRTMGIPVISGREFDAHDRLGSPSVMMINQAAARELFPGENPIGKRLNVFWTGEREAEIIGVSADIRHNGLNYDPEPTIFLPDAQRANLSYSLVVRTNGDGLSAAAAVKQQIRAVDPDQGSSDIKTMTQIASESIARPRVQATLLSVFGLIALVLACMGIYAVISYSVEQRTREMGIRLALGAAPVSILRMVMREGLLLAGAGILAGLVGAAALTRYLATLLYAVRPTDAMVYVSVSAILAASAMAGCYVPARRATRVDPGVVLREE